MENEKDIFDLLREESENLSEVPPSDAWQRLEKKLTKTRKIKRKRRPMELQLIGVVVAVLLLIVVGVVSWFVTFQHQEVLRGRQEFAGLRFLEGEWSLLDNKMRDVMAWQLLDSLTLEGEKSLFFSDKIISKAPISIRNKGKSNILVFENKTYFLKNTTNNNFIFVSEKNQEVRLRKANNNRFTISFGEGIIFVFNRKQG